MTDALLALAFAPFFVGAALLVIDDMAVMLRRPTRRREGRR